MKHKKIKIILMLLCLILSYLVVNLYSFPKEINILAGSVNSLNFNLPFRGDIEVEGVAVLNVDNKPVSENINIDLSKRFSIEADENAELKMVFKIFGIPIKTVSLETIPDNEVVPCGMTVGVQISTNGILVLGTGYVNGDNGNVHYPSEGILKSGDLILEANGTKLENQDDLIKAVEESNGVVKLKIDRDNEVLEKEVKAVKNIEESKYKLGVWVRDSTKGIGTITYYNPKTGEFAALGHGILDVDTKMLMNVKSGNIMQTDITKIKKGKKGNPGELVGDVSGNKIIGDIVSNTPHGIFGKLNEESLKSMPAETMKIAMQSEVKEGPAVIRANVNGREVEEFEVYIKNLNRHSNDDSKGIVLTIVDQKLLQKTSGIVQGMSGSPIIQDGKLVGAVTHVFVQDPSKGYGIFIENMMKQSKKGASGA